MKPLLRPLASGWGFLARRPVRAAVVLALAAALGYGGWYGLRYARFRDARADARAALAEGRTRDALTRLAVCEEFAPFDREVLLLSAGLLRMTEAWRDADALLAEYAKRYGEDDDYVAARLMLKAASSDTTAVAAALQRRIAKGDDTARFCRHALVIGLLREFRFTDALAQLDAWRKESPDDPLALYLRGWLEEHRFNSQGAREAYEALLARCPNHQEGRIRLAHILMELLIVDEALAHLAILRETRPDNPEVAAQWAIALRQVGRTGEARKALADALARFPNSVAALTERGTVAVNDGDDQTAAESLARAVLIDPGAVPARQLLAQVLTRLGRTDEAAAEQARADALRADSQRMTELLNGPLQTRPNDPGPPAELAAIALRSGQPDAAIRWYEMALKRDPRHAPSHTALAVIYRELGNPLLATRHRALAASSGSGQ